MKRARAVLSLMVFPLVAACTAKDAGPADSTGISATAVAAPARSIADFAGTWQMMTTLEGVEKPVSSTLVASADGSAWTVSLEGRPNVAVTASMSGDSLITQTAEYESVLRKGVMVSVRNASVMADGALTGKAVATYKTATGTEVVNGTVTGTRTP